MKFPPRLLLSLLFLVFLPGCETAPVAHYPTEQDPVKAAKIHAILERSIQVLGGRANLEKLTGWEVETIMEVEPGGAHFPCQNWQKFTGEYRVEIHTPAVGALVEGFDGEHGWRENKVLGFGPMSGAEIAAARRNISAHMALKVEQTHPGRRLLPSQEIGGKNCDVIEMSGVDGVAEKWFFEAASGQLVREERPGEPGHPQGVVLEYSDFRPMGDVYTTAYVTKRTEGNRTLTFRVQKIVLNPVLDPDRFSAPAGAFQDYAKTEEILQRYLQAAGGAAALNRIHSRVTHTTVDTTTAGIKSSVVLSVKQPNLVLNEQDIPGIGHMVQGYDGHTAWASSEMQGYRVLQGAERQQLISSANLQMEAGLAQLYNLRKFAGERTVDGHRTAVVSLGNMQGVAGLHYFDTETGRLLRVETNFSTGPKGILKATVDFSDFRKVDGVLIAFKTTINNPAMRLIITIDSVVNNVPLEDTIFRPRKDD